MDDKPPFFAISMIKPHHPIKCLLSQFGLSKPGNRLLRLTLVIKDNNVLPTNPRVISMYSAKGLILKGIQIGILTWVIFAVLTLTGTQALALRCGSRLISEGDPKVKVLAECGEPDYVEVWEEERVYRFHYHPRYYGFDDNYEYGDPDDGYGQPYRIKKLIIVEEWTYNHGPTRFMDHLRLENGVVRRITSGDYGY
jgi:hypothetical protein